MNSSADHKPTIERRRPRPRSGIDDPHHTEQVLLAVPAVRAVIGSATLLFGVAAAANLWSGLLTDTGTIVTACTALTTVPAAAIWFTGRWPPRAPIALYVVYADIGVAAVLLSFDQTQLALAGCALFFVVASLSATTSDVRTTSIHLGFSMLFTVLMVALAIGDGADKWAVTTHLVIALALAASSAFVLVYTTALRGHAGDAVHDSLTGLLNRRGLHFAVARTFALPDTTTAHVHVHVVDIDAFKTLNDTFGHQVGDIVLTQVADDLRAHAPTSLIARLGGDEFSIIRLTDTANDDGFTAALRRRLSGGPVFTVSIGHVTAPLNTSSDPLETVATLLDRADHEMYQNKARRGRRTPDRQPARSDDSSLPTAATANPGGGQR